MVIGIDASRAFLEQRTGIEEYSYQVIKHLRGPLKDHQVVLYLRKKQGSRIDFELPEKWRIKVINFTRLWTQLGLALEMLRNPVDVLFIPAHIAPWIHPKKTIVAIHGLEYEFMPEAYSFWEKFYMRFSIKKSCRWAEKIIAVSKNTRKDLKKLYGVPEEKIKVIYEGYDKNCQFPTCLADRQISDSQEKSEIQNYKPYLLFIGRLEKRKNIEGIIAAFEILKGKYKIPHQLVLAGKPGYGWEDIARKLESSSYKKDIILTGFIDEAKKGKLFQEADIFLFPTFYEGFGLPILEAQASGVPVISSNVSSLPEVTGDGALYASPKEPSLIAEVASKLINDRELRDAIIRKGYKNLERFSWERCSEEIAGLLIGINE